MATPNSTSYTAVVQESGDDTDKLGDSHYMLQIAKAVSSGNKTSINVVYQSTTLSPGMEVTWSTQYGLNFTATMPNPGAKVVHSGLWQPCDIGQSFNLDRNGLWVKNDDDQHAQPDSLNVGSNDYAKEVHIIVGLQDPETKKWTAIWCGDSPLIEKAHGQYKPLEKVQIWYQAGDKSTTMISGQETSIIEHDMLPNKPHYFTYHATGPKTGTWEDQDTPFEFLSTPNNPENLIYEDLVPLISIRRGVTFAELTIQGLKMEA